MATWYLCQQRKPNRPSTDQNHLRQLWEMKFELQNADSSEGSKSERLFVIMKLFLLGF